MAGRIREEDIAEVREKVRIDEVIGEYVTLRKAGGGSLKGLCPFHDEKSPSFNVNPSRNFYHCFGCQEGGDAVAFLMKIDGLGFTEAVERLADKAGVQLRREDGDVRDDRPKGPPRQRLIEANKVAQEYYAEQLRGAEAQIGRTFLQKRGFDGASAEHFGMGFAPKDGEALLKHLRGRGFSTDESVGAGLVAVGRSAYDRFRGRLLWPIRDPSGATIGFGARRVMDDDKIEAKYLNTPETSLYKKSHVLYGIDLARTSIGKQQQAVVVEGYTDVMACHLAGVTTAVASCGTAFGEDHSRILRRFMADHDEFHGEVIFTFDGDAAGQKAALKAFEGDQKFVSQTYVAVQPDGLDPCDLRIRDGDDAVRALVSGRVPLYRFVLGNIVSKYDLDRADGRVDALRDSAKLVASVRDQSKVTAFAQEISRMIGAEIDTNAVLSEVRRAAKRPAGGQTEARPAQPTATSSDPQQPERPRVPDPRHPRFAIERETLKLVLQAPIVIGRTTGDIGADDFTHPTYRAVWELVAAAGGTLAGSEDPAWVARLGDAALISGDPMLPRAVSALAVEPLMKTPDAGYVTLYVSRLLELTTLRSIEAVKARLQRADPAEPGYTELFAELNKLEQQRRTLRDRIAQPS